MALRLHTTLTASDGGFDAAMSSAEARIQRVATAAKGVAPAAAAAAQQVGAVGTAAAGAADHAEQLINEANALAAGMGRAANEALGAGRALNELGGDAQQAASQITESSSALFEQAEAARQATEASNALARAQGEAAAEAARRMQAQAQAARDAAEAQRRLNELLGLRPSANDAEERAQDYAEWGRRIDAVRARYVPLEQQLIEHRRALEEIAEAERLGMLTAQEAVAARTRATAALRQAEAAHRQQAEAANGSAQSTMLASHEMANLSYQIQDVFVSLASGQNPFMILAQQGPQAASAVGGVGRLLSLIPPQLLLVAGVTAGLAVVVGTAYAAWSSYRESVLAVDRANRMAPVSIGLTRAALEQQARAAADLADISVKAAREQQAAYIATGKIGGDIMAGLIGISRDFAIATGQEMSEATALLAKTFADPTKGAEDLTRSMGLLDDASLAYVRSLAAMGRGSEAQAIILEALTQRVKGSAQELSTLGRVVSGVGTAFSNAWDWAGKKLGDLLTEEDPTEKLREQLKQAQALAALTKANLDAMAASGRTPENSQHAAAIAADYKAFQEQARKHQAELTRIEKLSEAERQAERAKQIGVTTGAMARQLDEYYARQEDLTNKQKALEKGLAEGAGFADRSQVEKQLERVKGALGSLMSEQKKAATLAQAEAAAVNMTGVARDKYLARVRAQIETSGQLLTAAERQEKIDQAVATATNQHATALGELTRQQRLAIDAQQRLAAAAGKGEAAQRAANDANEIAAATARSAAEGALAREAATRREAATVQRLASERVAGLTAQRQANDAMTEAVLSGAEAVRIAQRAEYQMAVTRELGAAATDKIAEAMAAYDAVLRSSDQLDWAKATAQQAVELQQVNGLLGVERANLTASNRQRMLAISHQEALNELSRIGLGWTQQEREEWLRNADAIAAARVEAEELNRLRSTIDDVASDAADAVYDAMTGRGDIIVGWFKALWKRIAVEALKQQIMLPIVTQVIGSAPGLFGATGAGATAATGGLAGVANFIGGGGLASSISGLSNLVSSGFSLGSLFGGGGLSAGAASLKASLFGQAGIRGTATSGLFGSGGTAFGSTMAANGIAGAFSGLGTGMLAGQVLGMLGIGKGNTTGSAIGGALGGAIGSIVPGIGTLLGSIAGGALGSLFGAGPSDKEGSAVLNLGAGSYQVGGFTGKKYSQENRDAAANIADQVLTLKQALEGFGARITGTLAVGVGDRDGLFATGLNTTARTRFESSEAGAQQLLGFVAQQFVGAIGSQLPAEISTALGRVDWSDLEQAGGDVDFIKGFRDSLQALRGDFGLTDQVTAEATAAVQSQVKAIREFRDSATRLFPEAMGEVDSTLRQYVDGLIGVRNAAPAMTEVEAALSALEARWLAYIPLMQEVGYSTAEAQALMASGLAKAKDAARGDWVNQMDREFNSLIGNEYINQIRDLRTARDTQYRNADALGADRGLVDRNVSAALGGILTSDLRVDQLQEAVRLFGTDFPEAAEAARTALAALTGGVEDAGNAAAEAAAQAERAARTGQAMDGLADRMARATGAADTLEGSLAIFDRAAAQERTATQARIAAGEVGAELLSQTEATLTAERLAIIRRFGDQSVEAETRRLEQVASVNRSISDRLFAARNDNSTLEGALAEFDRAAGRDRVEAARTAGADLAALDQAIAAERLAIIRRFGDQAAEAARQAESSLSDREFARLVAGKSDAEILLLERRQNAEFATAIATGYTTEQLERLRKVLAGEMTDAVNQLNDATRQTAAQARVAAQAVNDNLADRLFAATNDNSTLEGALAAFDRQAAKDRIETAQTAGADMLALDRALYAERQAIITRFTKQAIDAENQRLAALSQAGGQLRQWIDGIRSGNGTPEANLDTIRAQYQQQLTLARGGNVDAVQGLREYAQRLIDAESARTASGADRRAMVEAILAQLETVLAVKSYDQQVLEALQALGGGISVEVDLAVIRTITEVLSALPDEARDQLIQAQTIVRAIEERLGRSLTPVELDSLVEGGQITRDIRQLLGRDLTSSERAALIQADSVERRVEQLLGRQLTAAEAATLIQPGSVQRLIGQQVGAATGASLVLPETVTRTVNQVLTIQGQVLSSQALSQQIAIELGNVQFQGQAVANRYLAAIAWNTARMVGAGGEGLLITDDPAQAGDQTLREQRAAATLSVSGGGGNTDNGGIIAASDRIAAKIADLHAWQVQVWAVQSGLLDKTKYNTAETSKKLGGGYAYAGGTDYHPGGWARVGEEGEEFINLPRGAQVFSRAQTLELARQPRTVVMGVSAGGNDNRALTAAIERQARALERQNTLLEKIAANCAAGADAAAETAKALKTPARVRVGTVAKMAGGRS